VSRDPRIDPKPGDVLFHATRGTMRLVIQITGHFWVTVEDGMYRKTCRVPSLPQFHQWAKNAQVTHAAE
jgi:hypothetical protein